ncbi:Ferritin-like protein [Enterobacter sp. FY-07]|uniref:ferritin-like domain-containing protein n=1 Tax=Kosakonia oryzendophytica TaxID=1005665 RepID=UPI000777B89D|nr:ferritin-like domain-containing protein [Kosakonia oryzendophytica]AMO49781.1 Ferritin-like protein [Enterobacter sp. FY-07]TDT59344.1 ferritin [Enterobacter sp. AG5470]WBT60293.1 ferritin-like domain-containing protein [Kosakonia oryzendophytica]
MLPGELVIKLNQHMNMEFRAASVYIAKSSWLIENEQTEIAQQFRLLAQTSITATLKFYEFLTHNHSAPFLSTDIPSINEAGHEWQTVAKALFFDFNQRTDSLSLLERLAVTHANLPTSVFLIRVREVHQDEAQSLRAILKEINMNDAVTPDYADYDLLRID